MITIRRIAALAAAAWLAACGAAQTQGTDAARAAGRGAPTADAFPLRFDYAPDEIRAVCAAEQARLGQRLAAIAAVGAKEATFANTVAALEDTLADFNEALGAPLFLNDVSPDAAVRDAADECTREVGALWVDVMARPDLYAPLKAAAEKGEELDVDDQRLLDEYLRDFRRNGLELPAADLARLVALRKELVEVTTDYMKNLSEWSDFLAVTREQLDGLPDDYIAELERTEDGLYKVGLSYPEYFPFMENARDADARRALEAKYNRRGGEANRDLLQRAIALRAEMAQLLGYATHSHYVLEARMAETPEAVRSFLARLQDKLTPRGHEELQTLAALKRETTGEADTAIRSWDWRYYDTMLKRTRYEVDDQLIKEYFPLDAVLTGMFDIYQTLLGVRFVELPAAPRWHQDVLAYAVVEEATGEVRSYFYMDLFPRDGKYNHAAAFPLRAGREAEAGYVKPVSSIVANFPKPAEGRPALLTHDDVETMFHEFGHIMHQVLTTARYASSAGTSVMWDYVEAPSQIFENWVWEKEGLAKIARHYQTGEGLPDELLDRMLAAKRVNAALRYLRQVFFATLDLTYHSDPNGVVDTTAIYAALSRDVALIPIQEGTYPEASFSHLVGGYDSGYYGYLWSEVFAQDMYTRFEAEGLFNPETGRDYRRWILEPGGARPPLDLIRGFLGREPNEDAFLRSLGIEDDAD